MKLCSFVKPSVGCRIAKSKRLSALRLSGPLPPARCVRHDLVAAGAGAEFHSRALKTACREYGINFVYRPPATARFGGHIERLIGTMMGAVHILPGTTFSKTKGREGYASEERAALSLRELERCSRQKSPEYS